MLKLHNLTVLIQFNQDFNTHQDFKSKVKEIS